MSMKAKRDIKREREEKQKKKRQRREKINTREMAAKEGKRSQITKANTVCANNVCV